MILKLIFFAKELQPGYEKEGMSEFNHDKAFLVVQKVLSKLKEKNYSGLIEAVAEDDIVFLAERMLYQQKYYKYLGIPFHIDIGYHYTSNL